MEMAIIFGITKPNYETKCCCDQKMDRMFCSSVLQQVAANNLCLNFHHLHLVIVPYLTPYMIVISPLVSLMSAKFEIIGIKSRLQTSHLLSGGGGGGSRGCQGAGILHLRNQNFYATIYFPTASPHTPQISDRNFMAPYPTHLPPSNLQTHMTFYLFFVRVTSLRPVWNTKNIYVIIHTD